MQYHRTAQPTRGAISVTVRGALVRFHAHAILQLGVQVTTIDCLATLRGFKRQQRDQPNGHVRPMNWNWGKKSLQMWGNHDLTNFVCQSARRQQELGRAEKKEANKKSPVQPRGLGADAEDTREAHPRGRPGNAIGTLRGWGGGGAQQRRGLARADEGAGRWTCLPAGCLYKPLQETWSSGWEHLRPTISLRSRLYLFISLAFAMPLLTTKST